MDTLAVANPQQGAEQSLRRGEDPMVEGVMAAATSQPPRPRRTFRSVLQAKRLARRAATQAKREQRAQERRDLWQDAKNLPNLLTFLRVLMIPLVLVFLERGSPRACFWAGVVYSAAAITDMLDGWLARRQGLVSVLGKFLDPLADKLIVAAVLVWLVSMGRIPAWAVVVLLSREITITALRGVASSEGLIIAAGDGGKLKTALQMVGIICLIVGYPYDFWLFVDFGRVDFVHVGRLLVYLSIVFSITSAASYLQLFAQAVQHKNRPISGQPS
jgi:CDP-diacylglycerol--glycerol-3-phosphate 3-phosphatidyltransferase